MQSYDVSVLITKQLDFKMSALSNKTAGIKNKTLVLCFSNHEKNVNALTCEATFIINIGEPGTSP